MDLLGYSNENFRKCGEITTALKVGKKVYAFNCGFCSKDFIKFQAFTAHIGEDHEQELFGYLQDYSWEELPGKDEILTDNDTPETEEIKFLEITKLKGSKEAVTYFQDPLEAASVSKVSKEAVNISDLKEEDETMVHTDNEDNCENYDDECINEKNDPDFERISNESEISSESDNEPDYLNEVDDTKELILAIIAGFEKHHILWDLSKPKAETRKKRIEAYKIIASSINKQMGMNLKWVAIRDRIKNLHSKFRSELQQQKHAESRGKIYTPIWYYDKLSFLKESLNFQPETQQEDDLQDEEPILNAKKLTLTIIQGLKENRILWDSSEPMSKTLKNRKEAFKIIAMSVHDQMGMELKWNAIRDRVKKLCNKFRSEVQKLKHAESRGKIYTPIWYYDKLSFLNASEKYTPKIKKKTQAKEITLALIAGFQKHRILWDANDSISKNRKQLIEAHKSIANSINQQMMTNLKWNHISDRIKKLCHVFRLEKQNQKVAKLQGEDYTPIWYYDKLLFLNTGKEYEQKKGELELAKEFREYELPLPTLSDSKNLELIEIYKSFPCLWSMEHIEYRVTNRRQEAINEMIQEIRTKFNLTLTSDELQKKMNCIRDAYSHETHRKLKCKRLNKVFTPFYKFYEQISFLQNNASPFKCDSCEETFDGFSKYKIHKSQHDGSMPFTCVLCSHGFADVSNYAVHMRRHAPDYPFECEVCKKRFAINDDVKRHLRFHTAERPFFCEVCGQSFRTNSYLNVHIRRHKKKPGHKCKICSKDFYEKFRLTIHMRTHLNIRDKVCNICGKAFKDTNQLRQHKEIHSEQKHYVCRICGKGFAQRAGLHGHMKSHGTALSSL